MTEAAHHGARAFLSLDRLVHEPARLAILTVLAEADEVEFRFLESVTGLTKGNISSHMSKLETGGYVTITKQFKGRVPLTTYGITSSGRHALEKYRAQLRALVEVRDSSNQAAASGPD